MPQQEQQTNNDSPDVLSSEPVPVTGPGQVSPRPEDDPDGRRRTRYAEGTGDQGPDALDERGSYDNDLATTGPGPVWPEEPTTGTRARDDRRGEQRPGEERAEDGALNDDTLPENGPTDPAAQPHGDDDRRTGDRGDLADASQADAADRPDTVTTPAGAANGSADDADDPSESDAGPAGATDRPEFHEPAPLPTSFGAPTVGGAVAAAALAGSHRDARQEDTVRSGDGPADDRIDGVGAEPSESSSRPTARQRVGDRSLGAADAATGTDPAATTGRRGDALDPLGRATPDGSAVVGTGHPVDPDVLSAGNPDALTGGAHGPDDRTGSGVQTEPAEQGGLGTEAEPEARTGPAGEANPPGALRPEADGGAAADEELLPGAAPAEPIVAILSPEAVQGFRDRWREVQLRFVDDPPGATADAHRLVEESVEAVTAALAQQRDDLGRWQHDGGGDTEQLRMVVRRHRDFLDRLLGR